MWERVGIGQAEFPARAGPFVIPWLGQAHEIKVKAAESVSLGGAPNALVLACASPRRHRGREW